VIPPPPPPPDNTGHTDPDYEVIEFPSQQYSNTEPVLGKYNKTEYTYIPKKLTLCILQKPNITLT
jgi:hypothetical protein